jgi:hypothetical protein
MPKAEQIPTTPAVTPPSSPLPSIIDLARHAAQAARLGNALGVIPGSDRTNEDAQTVAYPIFSTFSAFSVTNSEKMAEMAAIFPKVVCSAIIF